MVPKPVFPSIFGNCSEEMTLGRHEFSHRNGHDHARRFKLPAKKTVYIGQKNISGPQRLILRVLLELKSSKVAKVRLCTALAGQERILKDLPRFPVTAADR